VFFRDDEGPDTQFSSFDSVKREDLWTYQEVQRAVGHENVSIGHNSNVSNGLMFAPTTAYGTPITKEWAERSIANTVAVEMAQTKGTSETTPALSPTDEFADFETYYPNLLGFGRRSRQGRRQLRAPGSDQRHRLSGKARAGTTQVFASLTRMVAVARAAPRRSCNLLSNARPPNIREGLPESEMVT
jgi:hypothetical protein